MPRVPQELPISAHVGLTPRGMPRYSHGHEERAGRAHCESLAPIFGVQQANPDPQFSCFVEGCERKCRTPQKRRMHLIDKHMYPKNFFFAITREGVDGRRSMLLEGGHRRRRSSTVTKQSRRNSLIEPGKGDEQTEPSVKDEDTSQSRTERTDVDMDELAGAMSSLNFVPRSIRFGRGGRAGFAKS
jgi:hypothetical protein